MQWEKIDIDPMVGPTRRCGHTCNAVFGGRFLILIGGCLGLNESETSWVYSNDVYVYDTAERTWSQPAANGVPPTPRSGHSCTAVGNKLFLFGGENSSNSNVLNDLYVLDIDSRTWMCPSIRGEGPTAREGHSASLVGNKFFIFGGRGISVVGFTEAYYNDLYILDTETLVWTCATTSGVPPSHRSSHSCSTWRNQLIVIGGAAADESFSDVHILDTDTLVWRVMDTSGHLLPPCDGHLSFCLDGRLIVFGGTSIYENLDETDLYVLHIETGIWTKVIIPNGPSTRHEAAGDCLGPFKRGIIVVFGGHSAAEDDVFMNDLFYLRTVFAQENDQRPREKLALKLTCQVSFEAHRPSNMLALPGPGDCKEPQKGGARNALVVGQAMPSTAPNDLGFQGKNTIVSTSGSSERNLSTSAMMERMPSKWRRPVWHAPRKNYRVISGHVAWMRSVAVDPSNTWFCTGSADQTIKLSCSFGQIWDLASGVLKLTFTGHIEQIRGLAISNKHTHRFSVGDDKQVKCWDLEQNKDPQVVTGSHDSSIKMWDLRYGKTMLTLTNHKKSVRAIAPHPKGQAFASVLVDNIEKFALPKGGFCHNISQQKTIINAMAVNEEGVMVTGGDNGSMGFWDWKSGHNLQQTQTIVQPGSLDSEAGVYALTYDVTGTKLISCEADKTIKMWEEDDTATPETRPLSIASSFCQLLV